jgi:putative protease
MEVLAGRVINYYRAIGVISVKLTDNINKGDIIHIKGNTTDFEQKVESMQIMHNNVTVAAKGGVAGIKVDAYARKNDLVYKVVN